MQHAQFCQRTTRCKAEPPENPGRGRRGVSASEGHAPCDRLWDRNHTAPDTYLTASYAWVGRGAACVCPGPAGCGVWWPAWAPPTARGALGHAPGPFPSPGLCLGSGASPRPALGPCPSASLCPRPGHPFSSPLVSPCLCPHGDGLWSCGHLCLPPSPGAWPPGLGPWASAP